MGRRPCCKKEEVKNRAWTAEEDRVLIDFVKAHGEGRWGSIPKKAGLNRCGKSCRFRWLNYLRPGIKRGNISPDEEDLILRLHKLLGNRWSLIAGRLPGRTDNEIKNYWNTILYKRAQDDNHPKFKKPKLGHNPDQSEGTMKLELEENDNTFGKPCNSTLQLPLLESEQSESLATFWAETLKLSEVDISQQLSLRQDEDDNHCFGISEGAPRPCPPPSGGTPTKSENAEVEKNGSTIGLLSCFHPELEGSKDAVEDPVLGFDIGGVCLLDLLNSELLVGNSSSSTPSDPQLAFPFKETMVQDCNMIADSHQADRDVAPADHVINSLSSLFLFDNPEGELLDKREQDK